MPDLRFVVVSFDGLRPDLIDAQQTPNIVRLQRQGVTLARHRTVYPSETRVAFPSLVTGATSNRHGMVGNKFLDRRTVPPRYLDTADAPLLAELDATGGGLMTAPTLGEILAAAGKSLAVLATNTAGTTRLFHHRAERFGHLRLSGHFRDACTPADWLAEIEAHFGALPPVPPTGEPDFDAQTLITSVFLEDVWPRLKPDVTILSFGEPDTCSHHNGTGAAATRAVIAHCDRELGRVLDWWETEGRAGGVQLIAVSDHGHITGHTSVSVVDSLAAAGWHAAPTPGPDVDVVVVPGQVGALYLRDRGEAALRRLVETIAAQPWCGPIFTASRSDVEGVVPGTFSSGLVMADHERAPDAYFAFRADDGIDAFGLIGGTFYDNARREGLGVHGGLHPKELAAVGIVTGSAFEGADRISEVPSGICDFTPTLLHLFGLSRPASMTGRVLAETMVGGGEIPAMHAEALEVVAGGRRQNLRRVWVGDTIYLEGSTVD